VLSQKYKVFPIALCSMAKGHWSTEKRK